MWLPGRETAVPELSFTEGRGSAKPSATTDARERCWKSPGDDAVFESGSGKVMAQAHKGRSDQAETVSRSKRNPTLALRVFAFCTFHILYS